MGRAKFKLVEPRHIATGHSTFGRPYIGSAKRKNVFGPKLVGFLKITGSRRPLQKL